MMIETANGKKVEATAEKISEILGSGPLRGDLIILEKEKEVYLQAWIAQEPCMVEYRDGSESRHFQAKQSLTIPELEALMQRYLEQRPDWMDGYDWVPLSEVEPGSGVSWNISFS